MYNSTCISLFYWNVRASYKQTQHWKSSHNVITFLVPKPAAIRGRVYWSLPVIRTCNQRALTMTDVNFALHFTEENVYLLLVITTWGQKGNLINVMHKYCIKWTKHKFALINVCSCICVNMLSDGLSVFFLACLHITVSPVPACGWLLHCKTTKCIDCSN